MARIDFWFPGGKHKVLTMSYDDGRTEDRRLVAMFNKYGIRGTFNINSGIYHNRYGEKVQPEEFKELYKGHEVACHTYTHPTIERCPITAVMEEVMEDRKNLEAVMGYPVRGLAYPNGSYSKEIEAMLPILGIKYGRVVGDTHGFSIPQNFYEWKATCHHTHGLLDDGQRFVDLHKTQYLYMMYVWGHSFEFDTEEKWQVMEDFCKLVGGKDDIWYATNIEIVDYLEATKRMVAFADNKSIYNPNAISVWCSGADGKPVEVKSGETVRLSE